ncbi:MAG: SDR family NAD(P)-dependent oxidoreductase [bacterium]
MGNVILISGGSDGLGREIARILAPDCQVVVFSTKEDKLRTLSEETGCAYQVGDVTAWDDVERICQWTIATYGRIDCLINNAGVWLEGPLDENTPAEISRVMNVNATGTMLLTRAALPQLKVQGAGTIINVISQAGITSQADRSVYYASKWAITGFTKCLQAELGPQNIKVTAVYPGSMLTSFFDKAGNPRDMSKALDPVAVAKAIVSVVRLEGDATIPEIGIKYVLK